MGIGLTLHQASIVIIIEPMYDPNLFLQMPKRAHRLSQPKEVWCYTIRTITAIEGRLLGLFGEFLTPVQAHSQVAWYQGKEAV